MQCSIFRMAGLLCSAGAVHPITIQTEGARTKPKEFAFWVGVGVAD